MFEGKERDNENNNNNEMLNIFNVRKFRLKTKQFALAMTEKTGSRESLVRKQTEHYFHSSGFGYIVIAKVIDLGEGKRKMNE